MRKRTIVLFVLAPLFSCCKVMGENTGSRNINSIKGRKRQLRDTLSFPKGMETTGPVNEELVRMSVGKLLYLFTTIIYLHVFSSVSMK